MVSNCGQKVEAVFLPVCGHAAKFRYMAYGAVLYK